MRFILLFMLVSCGGDTVINMQQDQKMCLDVKTIDGATCTLKTKTYDCFTKGEFTLDIKTLEGGK